VSDEHDHQHAGPGYASPQIAGQQPPEQLIYVAGLFEGTGIERPDLIAVVDVDEASPQYGQIVHRTDMPNVGPPASTGGACISGIWRSVSSCRASTSATTG
jgi:selenium-binding protein 1